MTIPWTGTGGLFTRMGKLGLALKQLASYQSSQLTNLTNTTSGIVAQLNAESDIQALVGSAYMNQLNTPGSSLGSLLSNVAAEIVNRMVYRDNPQIAQNLQSLNTAVTLKEVIRQMRANGQTVQSSTIGSTITGFPSVSPVSIGNGIVNVSLYRPSDGRLQENIYAENVILTCTGDSYVGNQTAGNETFTVTGEGDQPNAFAFDWPLGSDASLGLSAIDGNTNVGSGNLLNKSGMNDWTSNVPDNWSLVAGVAGTNIIKNTAQQYDGSACCEIAGDGTTNFNITQTFNASAGTTGTLSPLTQDGFCCFMKRDGTAAAAGVLTIDLIDGNNVVIQDANSVNNSFTIDLTALTTSYQGFTGQFRLPLVMPSTYKIRVRLTTGLTTGRSVYLDKLSLGIMSRFYVGGPSFSVHAGSTNFNQGDFATVALTNNRGGASDSLSTFQCVFQRLLPMLSNNLLLPTSATPTISDSSLIA